MKPQRVKEILEKIKSVKIAVCGDFCLDAYWILSPQGGEISVETDLLSEAVKKHYYTLGGASNIVANLAALQPAHIRCIGTIANDIFGTELTNQLNALGVDTSGIVIQNQNFDTVTFAKRYLDDTEQPRIDFGFFNKRSQETDDALIKNLKATLQQCDIVIFNQQVPGSITNPEFITRSNDLFQEFSETIVLLDSRHYSEKFKHVYLKTNDIEAARLNGVETSASDSVTPEDAEKYAAALFEKSSKPVFVTQGANGILVADSQGLTQLPAVKISNKIDTVGAGDTTLSAIALCLGADLSPAEAAEFANLAAAVTIQKLFQTGTASPDEILRFCTPSD
jgi:rfaE bifunctional protein kinase chain/domain